MRCAFLLTLVFIGSWPLALQAQVRLSVEGDRIRLHFKHAGELASRDGKPLT